MNPEFKTVNLQRIRCFSCRGELAKLSLNANSVNEVLVCINKKCQRFGLLTVAYVKLKKKDEPKKSRDKGISKKSV